MAPAFLTCYQWRPIVGTLSTDGVIFSLVLEQQSLTLPYVHHTHPETTSPW